MRGGQIRGASSRYHVGAMLPLVSTLRGYRRDTFRADLIAGLTVAVMLVPQAMAYAVLAGMPPVSGLYAAIVPLAVYAVLGTSGSLAVGPVAIISLLTAAALAPLANGDPMRHATLAATLALMVGAIQVLLGAIRAGRLVSFLSHGVISGFTSAAAIVIAVSQIPSLLGLEVERSESFLAQVAAIGGAIDSPDVASTVVGVGALVALLMMRRFGKRLPGPLLVVVIATAATWALGLADRGVSVLGEVPRGLSSPSLPAFESLAALAPAAFTIAIIGYAEGIGIAKAIAARTRQSVSPNQELVAVGAANLAAGIFSAFPVAGGLSRTAVNHEAGSRTTVSSLVTAASLALTVTFLTPLFTSLPKAVLAAVVVAAVLRLVDVGGATDLFGYRPWDGAVLVVTFLATLVMSVEIGLMVGVAASIAVFLARSSQPHIAELGLMPGTGAYRNRLRYDVELDPRLLILRVDGPLFYASAQAVRDRIDLMLTGRPDTRMVVVDASAMVDLDADGVHVLERLAEDLAVAGIGLALATVRGPVRDLIGRSHAAPVLADRMVPDIPAAIRRIDGQPTEDAYL